jgi:hypothetical protein
MMPFQIGGDNGYHDRLWVFVCFGDGLRNYND